MRALGGLDCAVLYIIRYRETLLAGLCLAWPCSLFLACAVLDSW